MYIKRLILTLFIFVIVSILHCAVSQRNINPASKSKGKVSGKPLATNIELQADSLEFDNKSQAIILRGNASAVRGDVRINADVTQVDVKDEKIFAYKKVDFWQGKKEIRGNLMVYNMKTGRGYVEDAYTYENRKPANYYYKLKKLYYRSNEQVGYGVRWTSCEHIDDPHYRIDARKIVLVPEEKIILFNASYYIGKMKILTVGRKVIPLNQRKRSKFKPSYSKTNGYYLESSYDYEIDKNNTGRVIFNYYQKRGIGAGVSHNYKYRLKSSGTVYAYYFDEKRWVNDVAEDYRTSKKFTMSNSLKMDSATNISTNLNYFSDLRSGEIAANEEMNIRISANHRKKSYSLALQLDDRIDMDGDRYTGDDNYRVSSKSPELRIRTNNKPVFKLPLSFSTNTILGKYTETYQKQTKSTFKEDFTINTFSKPLNIFDFLKVTLNNTYRKIFYESGERIESVYSRAGTTLKMGDPFTLNVNYDYRTTSGHTPLASDRMGSTNRMANKLAYKFSRVRGNLMSLYYDFITDRFSGAYTDLTVSSIPKANFKWNFYLKGDYTLGDMTLNSFKIQGIDLTRLYTRFSVGREKGWDLLTTTSYDTINDKFSDLNNVLKFNISDVFDVSLSSRYDFTKKELTSLNYNATWNLHCYAARMSWQKQTRDFQFLIYVKAFPDKQLILNYDADEKIIKPKFGNMGYH
ncbi:LPS-assembly protein LptD [bacterium]|nr:LPS-assembly protein LptD [bacterium]